eukprot:scaffold3068_cov401-Prasinococcus_capsulatus_cf.AAC.4
MYVWPRLHHRWPTDTVSRRASGCLCTLQSLPSASESPMNPSTKAHAVHAHSLLASRRHMCDIPSWPVSTPKSRRELRSNIRIVSSLPPEAAMSPFTQTHRTEDKCAGHAKAGVRDDSPLASFAPFPLSLFVKCKSYPKTKRSYEPRITLPSAAVGIFGGRCQSLWGAHSQWHAFFVEAGRVAEAFASSATGRSHTSSYCLDRQHALSALPAVALVDADTDRVRCYCTCADGGLHRYPSVVIAWVHLLRAPPALLDDHSAAFGRVELVGYTCYTSTLRSAQPK